MCIPRVKRVDQGRLALTGVTSLVSMTALMLMTGCGPAMEMVFQRSGYHQGAPRPPNCQIVVFTAPPGRIGHHYVELGRVEWRAQAAWKRDSRHGSTMLTRAELVRRARPFACRAGGNGLILGTQGWAGYHFATVIAIRRLLAPGSPPADTLRTGHQPATPPAKAPPPAPPSPAR